MKCVELNCDNYESNIFTSYECVNSNIIINFNKINSYCNDTINSDNLNIFKWCCICIFFVNIWFMGIIICIKNNNLTIPKFIIFLILYFTILIGSIIYTILYINYIDIYTIFFGSGGILFFCCSVLYNKYKNRENNLHNTNYYSMTHF
jgi:hypothetical protein